MITWLAVVLFACDPKTTDPVYFDVDGDGYTSDIDCNDDDASVYPEADELCDELDNDCDGSVDEDPTDPSSWYVDSDSDGFGDAAIIEEDCTVPEGYVDNSDDCDDQDIDVYPGAFPIEGEELCILDADGDGYGDMDPPAPYDAGTDCDDSSADINLDAIEICDLLDNDCDQLIDDEDDDIDETHPDTEMWYADEDGDFFGDANNIFYTCGISSIGSSFSGDCNDADATIHPDADEVCDEVDNDCDGLIDDFDEPSLECDACTDVTLTDTIGEVLSETTLVGDDQSPSCAQGSNDTVLRWTAPATGDYTFSSSADHLALWQECGVTELACESSGSVEWSVERGDNLNIVLEGSSADLTIYAGEEYVCDDGIDDDNDGDVDCDDEDGCWFDANCGGAQCPNFMLLDPVNFNSVDGNMVLETSLYYSGDDEQASCFASGGEDLSYLYDAAETGCVQFIAYSDTMDVHLANMDSCGGTELDCNAGSAWATSYFGTTYGSYLAVDVTAGQSYTLIVDGVSTDPTDTFAMAVLLNNLTDCNGNVLQ